MSNFQYLYRRPSGVYFVRFCVPTRFKTAVGKGEVHRSTGCKDYRLAKIVAAELAAHWHRAITALECMDIRKIKAGSIKLFGDGYISLTEAAETFGTSTESLAKQLRNRRVKFYVEADNWLGWHVDDINQVLPIEWDEVGQMTVVWNDGYFNTHNPTRFSGQLQLRFSEEAIDVVRSNTPYEICQFLTSRITPHIDRGFVYDIPGRVITAQMLDILKTDIESLRLSLASHITPEMLLLEDAPRFSKEKSDTTDSLKFSEFTAEYLNRKCTALKKDQRDRRKDQCKIFLELMGDLPLGKINRTVLRQFSDLIAKIPDERHNVRRKYKLQNSDFNELISLADKLNLPRLTVQSQNRLLDGVSEIFSWAVAEQMMTNNPAKGLGSEALKNSGIERIKPQDQRDPLSPDDLNGIFSSSWFVNGSGQKTPTGKFYAYRPYYFWLPLLALFNGGRLNELCQLYLSDIKIIEDIACLDFNLMTKDKLNLDEAGLQQEKATDKSLKTINAVRIVPIHQKILDLGFMEYVAALCEQGYTRLFPELKFDISKGYGRAAGKWFNEKLLGTTLKIERNGRKTFHSMRHNFATSLGSSKVDVNIKADFMGHARIGAQAEIRYDKGDLEEWKISINKIAIELPPIAKFNIDDGLNAIQDALNLKSCHTGSTKSKT